MSKNVEGDRERLVKLAKVIFQMKRAGQQARAENVWGIVYITWHS